MKFSKIFPAAVAFSIALAAGSAMAGNAVVRDARNNVVHDSNGGCVYTKWEVAGDDCSGKQPQRAIPQARNYQQQLPTPQQLSQEQRTVYFDFDKNKLTNYATEKLNFISDVVRQSKQVIKVNVFGYTDEIGSKDYNIDLSYKRAHAVQDYLAQQGLDTGVVDLRGFGKDNPVKNCDDATSRAARIKCLAPNRRVEVEMEYYK